jgi:hypothetical protein
METSQEEDEKGNIRALAGASTRSVEQTASHTVLVAELGAIIVKQPALSSTN